MAHDHLTGMTSSHPHHSVLPTSATLTVAHGVSSIALELDRKMVSFLRPHGIRQVYQPGQIIFYEGHRPIGLYVHESGSITFIRRGHEACQCVQTCLMGIHALRSDSILPFTARAKDEVAISFLARSTWEVIRTDHPEFLERMNARMT